MNTGRFSPLIDVGGPYWCRTAHIAATAIPFPEKYLVAGAGPFFRQARPQYRAPPYSTATDAEPVNRLLRVLRCGPEWGRAELGHEENPAIRARSDSGRVY